MERTILEQCLRYGMPLPTSIENAPELRMGNEFYYTGFLDLTSCRQLGMAALGPISMMTIIEYCEAYDIHGELRDDFIWMVQRLDQKYLEWSRNRAKQ